MLRHSPAHENLQSTTFCIINAEIFHNYIYKLLLPKLLKININFFVQLVSLMKKKLKSHFYSINVTFFIKMQENETKRNNLIFFFGNYQPLINQLPI